MTALVVTVSLMLAFSFFCSISEAALYSVPTVRVETLRQRQTIMGLRLAALRDRIDRPITAILFLNTFANTMGAAIAGSIWGERFGPQWLLPFSLVLTTTVLVVAEIVPNSLGVGYARTLAPWLAWPIQGLIWMFYPLVHAGELLTKLLKPGGKDAGPSEEEIVARASLGARGGAIMHREARWVKGVLELDNHTARDIMTPRPVLATIVGTRTVEDLANDLANLEFSRFPVTTEEGVDHITGVVMRRDLVNSFLAGHRGLTVAELQKPAHFVPEATRGHQLLRTFIKEKTHQAVVVDEYGGTVGVVTLEDVIETILGEEIVDEFDAHPDLREVARRRAAIQFGDQDK